MACMYVYVYVYTYMYVYVLQAPSRRSTSLTMFSWPRSWRSTWTSHMTASIPTLPSSATLEPIPACPP